MADKYVRSSSLRSAPKASGRKMLKRKGESDRAFKLRRHGALIGNKEAYEKLHKELNKKRTPKGAKNTPKKKKTQTQTKAERAKYVKELKSRKAPTPKIPKRKK